MSQDLRLYSLSLIIMLMLWTAPVHADYGRGSGCPILAVPVTNNNNGVWSNSTFDESDFRGLFPKGVLDATVTNHNLDFESCEVEANSGTYYDGANHLWVLNDDITCYAVNGNPGPDFRGGDIY